MVLVKLCSLGTESRKRNLDLVILGAPTNMRQLYLVGWVGFDCRHASLLKESSRRKGFWSVVFRLDFVLLRDRAAALDHRSQTPQSTWGTCQPSCLESIPWLVQ